MQVTQSFCVYGTILTMWVSMSNIFGFYWFTAIDCLKFVWVGALSCGCVLTWRIVRGLTCRRIWQVMGDLCILLLDSMVLSVELLCRELLCRIRRRKNWAGCLLYRPLGSCLFSFVIKVGFGVCYWKCGCEPIVLGIAPGTQIWRDRLHVMGGSKENRHTPRMGSLPDEGRKKHTGNKMEIWNTYSSRRTSQVKSLWLLSLLFHRVT